MAEKVQGKLAEMVMQLGPPDSATELFAVPASHKQLLDGADFACRHIAKEGTGSGRGFYHIPLPDGSSMAMCADCYRPFQNKAAKAGK
jgi:hypothetical protein